MFRYRTTKKKRKNGFRVVLIGIGPQGPAALPVSVQERITRAEELWAPEDLLDLFPSVAVRHRLILKRLRNRLSGPAPVPQFLHVLCHGDPGLNGLVSLVQGFCGEEDLEILPAMDPLQEAAARLTMSWNDVVRLYTSHSSLSTIRGRIRQGGTIAVYASEEVPAGDLLLWIQKKGLHKTSPLFLFFPQKGVWKDLLSVESSLKIPLESLPPTGLFLFLRNSPDKSFQTSSPLLPHEIQDGTLSCVHRLSNDETLRNLVFNKIQLYSGETFWDLGAAEGAVSLACAKGMDRQNGEGLVFSVEWEETYLLSFLKNLTKHPTERVKLFQGDIPGVFHHLKDPDAVLVQERVEDLTDLLPRIVQRINPGGRVLVLAGSFSHAHKTNRILENHGFHVEVTLVPRSQPLHGSSPEGVDFLCLVLGKEKRSVDPGENRKQPAASSP